jgi:hypothetical protein
VHLRVQYFRAADIRADYDSQLSRGGLLVRVQVGEDHQQFEAVELELVAGPTMIALDAQLVQVFPIAGVAVTFTASKALQSWVEAACATASGDRDAEHSVIVSATPPSALMHAVVDSSEKPRSAALEANEKINTALRGNRDERAAILRENNPALHSQVLRNPGLQLDEIAAIAKMRTVSPELLKQIADRKEWAQRPEIAVALVRNPKTPVPIAVRLLDHVPPGELRQLAKDQNTRTPIQQAARKKVIPG